MAGDLLVLVAATDTARRLVEGATYSIACEKGEHGLCLRATCGCYCHQELKRSIDRTAKPMPTPRRPPPVVMRPGPRRGAAPKTLELPDSELVRRYQAGDSLGILAKAAGTSPPTVRLHLIDQGVHIRTKAEAAIARSAAGRNGHRARRPHCRTCTCYAEEAAE